MFYCALALPGRFTVEATIGGTFPSLGSLAHWDGSEAMKQIKKAVSEPQNVCLALMMSGMVLLVAGLTAL